jgi:pyridine nucleotide-disulfide oxidoreductase family protein
MSHQPSSPPPRLLLLGGGHAHLEVLRQLARRRLRAAEVMVVSPHPQHHYSSVVPGYLQGRNAEQEFTFDLPALCRAAGAEFLAGRAESIHPASRQVQLTGSAGRTLTYDILSIDAGSEAAGLDTPGAREFAATVRPMSLVIALRQRLDDLIGRAMESRSGEPRALAVCVVGAGAAGVEVALAISRRVVECGIPGSIALVDGEPVVLSDFAPAIQQRMRLLLERRGIDLRLGRRVERVDASGVDLAGGMRIEAALTIWLAGAAGPRMLRSAPGLPVDAQGYLLVDETLRALNDSRIFGAGDCVTLASHRYIAKAGVYAVREGPILAHNLRAALEGGRLRRYVPQRQFLAILNTGDGRALLRWRGLAVHTRWALTLKHWIDRRFVRKYQVVAANA